MEEREEGKEVSVPERRSQGRKEGRTEVSKRRENTTYMLQNLNGR